jgi:hypothetical protein
MCAQRKAEPSNSFIGSDSFHDGTGEIHVVGGVVRSGIASVAKEIDSDHFASALL